MVCSMPTIGDTHRGVRVDQRIDLPDTDKNNVPQVEPSRVRLRKLLRLPYVVNAVVGIFGKTMLPGFSCKSMSF